MSGENCRSGCHTRDHATYGQCLRDANAGVALSLHSAATQAFVRNDAAYRAARAEGLQPDSTKPHDIDVARAFSDRTGVAYDAGHKTETLMKAGGFDA